MTYFNLDRARPLGKGMQAPAGSVVDPAFLGMLRSWRRNVASAYRAMIPSDIGRWLPHGPYQVSPKIDGELWFLVFDEGTVSLVNPAARVIVGIPLLEEAAAWVGRTRGRTVLAGELFAATKAGRARSGDVAEALGGEAAASVQKLGFAAFDLLMGGEGDVLPDAWVDRHAILGRLLAGGQRVSPIKAERVGTTDEVSHRFAEWVEGGKGEGLVVRVEDGRIYKIKPEVHLDAVVIGLAERGEDPTQASSLLLALMREDGSFQLLGSVGNLGTEESRRSIRAAFKGSECPSRFRYATVDGTLFEFVVPEKVVEIRVTDLLTEGSTGERVSRMALRFEAGTGWVPLRMMPAVSPLFPVFERFRTDKSVNPTDVRLAQLLERCFLSEAAETVAPVDRPASTVLQREVYTKTTKGKVAVRKLLLWKTNKETVDPSYPAYVVHWTDYSPGRAEPLERTVRLAPDESTARALAADLLAENIKKGWEKVA